MPIKDDASLRQPGRVNSSRARASTRANAPSATLLNSRCLFFLPLSQVSLPEVVNTRLFRPQLHVSISRGGRWTRVCGGELIPVTEATVGRARLQEYGRTSVSH